MTGRTCRGTETLQRFSSWRRTLVHWHGDFPEKCQIISGTSTGLVHNAHSSGQTPTSDMYEANSEYAQGIEYTEYRLGVS